MGNESDNLEKLKLYTDMQQSEANLHWNRNNYFLVCSSILLLVLSQFNKKTYQLLVAVLGLILNTAWLFIQHRSSKYILYWKTKAQEIASSSNTPNIYPKIGGIEMRKVAYILPLAFILVWLLILILQISE